MSDHTTSPQPSPRRRLPAIWVLPIVAVLITAWLGYRGLVDRGTLVEITMASAEGLEAGKTHVKHKDIDLGLVEAIRPNADLSSVTVQARVNAYAYKHLVRGTRFWVVRPRLSADGISGLGTLISGSYIEMEPGVGLPARRFVALDEPPVVSADVPGTTFVLHTRRLSSVRQGAPISFHGVRVGEILGYQLSDADGGATVRAFVRAPHDKLVHEGTRFWNASGLSVDVGGDGVRLKAESVEALLEGGVAFDVPPSGEPGPLAKADAAFTLFGNETEARNALYTRKIPFILHVIGNAGGLSVGAPVHLRGMYVGEVTDVHMEYDAKTKVMSVPVTFAVEPQRVRILNSDPSRGTFEQRSYAAFDDFVRRGLRARVAAGNLLTGQKIVSLDFVQNAPRAALINGGLYPEIPSAGSSDVESIMQSANTVLASLGSTAATLNKLVSSPETKRSLVALDRSLANVERLTHDASVQTGPLLESLRATSKSADQALRQASGTLSVANDAMAGEGQSGGDLAGTLKELKAAARSLHALTDYLESHPQSLIRGKTAKEQP